MEIEYPYVEYPNKVLLYLNDTFPEFLPIEIPINPTIKKIDFSGFIIFSSGVVLIIILIAFGLKFWIVYLLIGAISLFSFMVSFQSIKDIKKYNKELMDKYVVNKEHIEIENIKRQAEFNRLRLTNQLTSYRTERIKQELKSFTKGLLSPNIEKKGVSESFFFKVLYKVFGKHINNSLKIDDYNYYRNYTPDFIFCNSDICIDIEVDEPYIMETRKPIHCNDQDNNSHRDRFFVNNNWCVIRFSEEQILLYPFECCKFIASIIYNLTDNSIYLKKLNHYGTMPKTSMWSEEQAIVLANRQFRELIIARAYNLASTLELYNENHFELNNKLLLTCIEIDSANNIISFVNNSPIYTKELRGELNVFKDIEVGDTIEITISDYLFNQQDITYHYPNVKPFAVPITVIQKVF